MIYQFSFVFSPLTSFSVPEFSPGNQMTLSCLVFLVSFYVQQCSLFSLVFMILLIFNSTSHVFYRISFNLGLSDIFSWLEYDYGFGEEFHRGEVPLSLYHIITYITPTWLITDGINLDWLVKVMYSRFLHCKVMTFSFQTFFLFYTLKASY